MSVTYCPQISYYHFSITYYSALYLLSNWLFSPFMEYDFWSQGTHLVHNSISLTSWHKVGYQHRHLLFLFSSFQIDVDPLENIFQFSSVTQSCSTLCDPTNHSTPGFPVHHQLLEFTQTHVHWVGDAIPPSHPLSSIPFSSCLQSFPASECLPVNWLFASSGQNIGALASVSILLMNI